MPQRRDRVPWAIGAATLLFVSMTLAVATQATPAMCVIDMGSNSFRRIVGSFDAGRYHQTTIEKRTLGVGDDLVRHGTISEAKLKQIAETLEVFSAACRSEGAAPARAVGTSVFRDAPNGAAVVKMAARLGITMEIASETRESQLAYLVGALGQDGYAVIDNGSRSIELVAQQRDVPQERVFNLGYRLAYDTFFAAATAPAAAVAAFRARLRAEAAKAPFMKGKKKLIGVEFAEMADVLFAPGAIEGRVFTLEELSRKLREITSANAQQFQAFKQIADIDRALPRLVVAATLVEEFGYSQLELTERELGVGLIIEAGLRKP